MRSTATAPNLAPPRPVRVPSRPTPRVLVVTEGDGADFLRALSGLDTTVRVVDSVEAAIDALSQHTTAIVIDAPLPHHSAEEALDALAAVDEARLRPVFVAVTGDFSDARAQRLYDEGATAVVSWPAEVLLLPRLLSELSDVSLADHEKASVDAALTEATLARLAVDPDLADVGCQVRDGVARLNGRLDSLWKARRLRNRIASVPGIVALEDGGLELHIPSVADDVLSTVLRTTLAATDGVDDSTVSVTVREGVATLAGVVESKRRLRRLLDVAETVRGIVRIENLVTISKSGAEVGHDHAETLQSLVDGAFPSSKAVVKAFGRIAVVSGTAATLAERTEIEEALEDAGFIDRVVNKMDVARR